MLSESKLQALVCTTNIHLAEQFYCEVLGLRAHGRSHGALVLDVGGTALRLSPVPSLTVSEHTLLGVSVPDVDAVVEALQGRGVSFARFPGLHHRANGTIVTPEGAKVAWFKDPDGNILSIVQYKIEN